MVPTASGARGGALDFRLRAFDARGVARAAEDRARWNRKEDTW